MTDLEYARSVVCRLADQMVAGLRQEDVKPFTGLAYGTVEAIEILREQICAELLRGPGR